MTPVAWSMTRWARMSNPRLSLPIRSMFWAGNPSAISEAMVRSSAFFSFLRRSSESVSSAIAPSWASTVASGVRTIADPGKVVIDHQMAELEVDPLAGRLGRDADLDRGTEFLLRLLSLAGTHPAVDLAGRVAPGLQVLADAVEGVTVLGEDEELPSSVLELGELGFREAFPKGRELGVVARLPDFPRLLDEFLERGYLQSELVEFLRSGILVDQAVAVLVIEIILILFRVHQTALEDRQPLRTLGRGQSPRARREVSSVCPDDA